MLDYNKINRNFGVELSSVPSPKHPFKLKTWHILSFIAIGLLAYKGAKEVMYDVKKYLASKKSNTKDNNLA